MHTRPARSIAHVPLGDEMGSSPVPIDGINRATLRRAFYAVGSRNAARSEQPPDTHAASAQHAAGLPGLRRTLFWNSVGKSSALPSHPGCEMSKLNEKMPM